MQSVSLNAEKQRQEQAIRHMHAVLYINIITGRGTEDATRKRESGRISSGGPGYLSLPSAGILVLAGAEET